MEKIYSLFLICLCVGLLTFQVNEVSSCSVITTDNKDSIWFGYNEDRNIGQFDQVTKINFYSQTAYSYARMEVTAEATNIFSIRTGMNEKGIAISGNAVPMRQINPHPEKLYTWKTDSFYRLILEKCSNISDAREIIDNFEFKPYMNYQIHIADSNGDAIVVSPGSNGEIAITQKSDNYFISTNANRADIENGLVDTRNDVAISLLNKGEDLGKETLKTTLKGVHQESYEGCTFYSTIFNLKDGIAYFYFMHDYNKEISFNLTNEVLQDYHYYLLFDLFPNGQSIFDQTKQSMEFQETMFLFSRGVALILIIFVIGHLILNFYKNLKTKENSKLKLQKITISIALHGYLIIFFVFSASVIPAIFFTDYLIKSVNIGIFDLILIVYFIISLIGITLLSIWIYKKRKIIMNYINRS